LPSSNDLVAKERKDTNFSEFEIKQHAKQIHQKLHNMYALEE